MKLIRRTAGLLALTLLLACASDGVLIPVEGLRFAFSQYECGPADGPAIGIYLTRDPADGNAVNPPYIHIYIDLRAGNLDGSTHDVAPQSPDAAARFVNSQGNYDFARAGSVTAHWTNGGLDVVGAADVVFNNAGHLVSSFDAPLGPTAFICG